MAMNNVKDKTNIHEIADYIMTNQHILKIPARFRDPITNKLMTGTLLFNLIVI